MFAERISKQVGDAFVQSHQNPIRCARRLDDSGILCAAKPLVQDGIGIVPQVAEVVAEFNWKVLIELEFHVARMGTKRSSRASSAA